MQLKYLLGARFLVQSVDVLRDNSTALARAFPFSELAVCGIRLRIQCKHLCPIEAIKLLGFAQKERVAENGLRRVLVLLVV